MCRYYAATRREPYTRLCYRYGADRGRHVPGNWPCGTYPKPGRARRSREAVPGERSPRERSPTRCACGGRSVDYRGFCENCYIQEQLHTGSREDALTILSKLCGSAPRARRAFAEAAYLAQSREASP